MLTSLSSVTHPEGFWLGAPIDKPEEPATRALSPKHTGQTIRNWLLKYYMSESRKKLSFRCLYKTF